MSSTTPPTDDTRDADATPEPGRDASADVSSASGVPSDNIGSPDRTALPDDGSSPEHEAETMPDADGAPDASVPGPASPTAAPAQTATAPVEPTAAPGQPQPTTEPEVLAAPPAAPPVQPWGPPTTAGTGGQHAAERPRPPGSATSPEPTTSAPGHAGDTSTPGHAGDTSAPGHAGDTSAPAPLTGSPADRRAIDDRTVVDTPPPARPAFGSGSTPTADPPSGSTGDTAIGATAVVPPLGAPPATAPAADGPVTTPGIAPPGTVPPESVPQASRQSRRPLPEPPRRPGFGRHLLGVLVGLLVTPVALVLTGLGADRIADVVGGTEPTDVLAIVLLALGAALLAVVVLLGAWSPAVPITGGTVWGLGLGVTYLVIPRTLEDTVASTVGDQLAPEALASLTWFAASGVLVVTGVLLLTAGLATGFARRTGRRWAELVAAADAARARGTGPA